MKLHGKKDNWKDKSKDKSKKEKKEKTLGGKVLTKGALAEALAIDTGFKRQDCTKIIDSLFKVAVYTVQKHGKFVLPGLAMFQSRDKPATEATEREIEGTMVEVKAKPAMTVVSATALAAFKKAVNGPREDQKTFWADAKPPKPEETETEAKSPASSGWSTLAEQVTAKLESPKHELTSPTQSSKQEWTPPPPPARGPQPPRITPPPAANICPPPPPAAAGGAIRIRGVLHGPSFVEVLRLQPAITRRPPRLLIVAALVAATISEASGLHPIAAP